MIAAALQPNHPNHRPGLELLNTHVGLYQAVWYHWRPLEQPGQHVDTSAMGNTRMSDYREFSSVIHATHVSSALLAFRDKQLKAHPVIDATILSRHQPPINCVWVAPNTALVEPSMYGPIVMRFNLTGSGGIIGEKPRETDWKYYWVETIDYSSSQAATRILVTTKTYGDWPEYDPTIRGGPWYWEYDEQQKVNRQHYLPRTPAFSFWHGRNYRNHVVEFVRERSFEMPSDLSSDGLSLVRHANCKKFRRECIEQLDVAQLRKQFITAMLDTSTMKVQHYDRMEKEFGVFYDELKNHMHFEGLVVSGSSSLPSSTHRRTYFKTACWAMEKGDNDVLESLLEEGLITLQTFRAGITKMVPFHVRADFIELKSKRDADEKKQECDDVKVEDAEKQGDVAVVEEGLAVKKPRTE